MAMASLASNLPDARLVQLIAASGQADEKHVCEILAESLSWSSTQGRDALRQSLQKVAARGNVPVTRLLLEKGADVEPRRELEYPALFKAAEAGHVGVVTQLLEHGANPNVRVRMRFHQTPLFAACFRGHNKVVELLLEHNANVNIRDKEGRTPLLFMVAKRDRTNRTNRAKWTMETLVLLLGRGGADREARDNTGRTPLLWAAANGYQDVVKALLDDKLGSKAANVSAANNRGRTALHLAAEANLHAMVRLLLDHKADPNAISDGGWTALHNAAQNGHHDVVDLLLKQNVNVNAELSNGMTPLHWAASNGHEAVVGQLLKHAQTRIDLKDSFDRTPMLCAAAGFHPEIVRMLSPERTAYRLSEAARLACEECKATVVDFGTFRNNKKQLVTEPRPRSRPRSRPRPRHRQRLRIVNSTSTPEDEALEERRRVYRLGLYARHIGANGRSRHYQDLTPSMFQQDPDLTSRARSFIRRELQVLWREHGLSTRQRTVRNRHQLIEYIVLILKSLDIQGNGNGNGNGIEEMLAQDLGSASVARHFLHELRCFLRSPYLTVTAWDRHVQYGQSRFEDNDEEVSGNDSELDRQERRQRREQQRADIAQREEWFRPRLDPDGTSGV